MRSIIAVLSMTSILVPAALSLVGCGRSSAIPAVRPEPAHLTVLMDVSLSTAVLTDQTYANRVVDRISTEFATFQLGDVAQVVVAGDRSLEHAVNPPAIATGYRLRMPAAKGKLAEQLNATIAKYRAKGDGSTNLLMAIREARPVCTNRSKLVIVSDGIEESTEYDVGGRLVAHKPIDLPAPQPGMLRGCKIEMVGLGTVGGLGKQSILPDEAMQALRTGWSNYFRTGGVAPSDIDFQTIL